LSKVPISRRKFIKILGGLAVAAGVSGVLYEQFRPKDYPAKQVKPDAYTQDGKSLVSIIKGNSDADIDAMVRAAVSAIGGIGKLVSSGKTVVVKPAVLTSDPNCAPDPKVVAAVIKLARDAGGRVIVAETSGGGNTEYCLSQVGITSASQAAGAEVKPLTRDEEIPMEVPKGTSLRRVRTYKTIYGADVIISVPRLKRHGNTAVTISLKNMMGVIPQAEMGRFHNTSLSQCIADLNTVLKPDLTVVDATYAMAGAGPTGGTMVRMDTVMASGDAVAIDRVGAQRLQEIEQQRGIPSFKVADVTHISAAATLGVGTNDLSKISIIERTLE